MNRHLSKKRKIGISTKTSLFSGLIVLILLAASSIVSINLQSSLTERLINEYAQSQGEELKKYSLQQKKLLKENTKIYLEICSNVAESFIYNFDQNGLYKLLATFMKMDGITAIKVLDAENQPFAAAWKDSEIRTGNEIPSEIVLNEKLSYNQDSSHDGEKVGSITIYYTEQLVENEIISKKKQTEQNIDDFNGIATKSIANSVRTQIIVAFCIVGALIVSIVLCLQIIVSRPISRISEGLNKSAERVASTSGQMSLASQSLAQGSSEQAASIEETSASLEEMASMTRQNADNAAQADNLMGETNQVVVKANDSMEELTQSMEKISSASEKVSKIIKTIDEIAFQTNLLALNAAVEAARAGEAGAGFAVVADEVRNLAMRAADAAKNTAGLIEGTVKEIGDGRELVSATNLAFAEVATSAHKVGELVSEIAAASREQAEGIGQVNKAVVEMDSVVQQNAANAEESSSASEEMNTQAVKVKGYVDELVKLVGGVAVKQTKAAALQMPSENPGNSAAQSATQVALQTKDLAPEKVIPLEEEDKCDDMA